MTLILNGDTGLSDVDGSAATPAIRGTDSNTGIYFPAADTIAFAEGGAEVARFDSSGNFGIGTSTPAVKLDVAGAISATGAIQASGVATNIYPLVAATAQASTSGTSIDFTSIPSWVKRITVMLYRMSTNGSSLPVVRVGTSGGIASSGYESVIGYGSVGGSFVVDTAHFGLAPSGAWSAGISYSGLLTITNITGNNWVASLAAASYGSIQVSGGGSVTLGGTLDRVRITTVNGTDTFDAGSINILYE